MELIPFKRPTDHYEEEIGGIDEQICELIRKRKDISNNNPGYPPFEYISKWAEKFNLYENQLKSVFSSLWNESSYKPVVEPDGFRKNLQILKIIEKDDSLFYVTFIRQYSNASLINFNIDRNDISDSSNCKSKHSSFELFIGEEYNCRMKSGCGSGEHYCYNFVVSPALPDDVSGIDLTFIEYEIPLMEKKKVDEIIIHL
ncbi:hypothetical protein [Clostridium beijerinckii]|uniref:Uncharacterized protein n=1 Tax=Clostridium beijerinckii TaxID=1520 RepID=A0A1S8S806_CLOBE|nr:hypothetical protein [Clostridium beijerinckii]NRY62396.1 hypothetical protein [Clostridium beijerinckii]OOM61638.1 hypothetical protein CLBCK_22250 [Clostridium beijerinckii]